MYRFKVRVRIRKLRDKGKGAEEKEYGADLCIIFSIDSKELKKSKVILLPAKNDCIENVESIMKRPKEKDQAKRM